MYEFSEKKNKYLNTILILAVVYIVIQVISSIDWYTFLGLQYKDVFDTYITVSNIASFALSLILSICTIIILFFLKKLRETEETKKLYGFILWFNVAIILIIYLRYYSPLIMDKLFPSYYVEYDERYMSLLNTLYYIYYYLALLIPVPIYILILKKEKLDINWMIIGRLTSIYLLLLGKAIYGIRDYLHEGIHYMTDMWFNKKYPFLAVLADNEVLIEIRGYFWIIGLIALVVIYKKKFAANKAKEEI